MEPTKIVLKPLVTEKTTWESEAKNRFSFEVHPAANKHQIREAIRKLYGVRVTGVATQNREGKMRRTRWGYARNRSWKRATVQIHPEDRIDVF